MRASIDNYMVRVIEAEAGKRSYDSFEDLDDWGLYHHTPQGMRFLLIAWDMMRRYNVLPHEGGLFNQEVQVLEDILTLERVYAYHKKRLSIEGE